MNLVNIEIEPGNTNIEIPLNKHVFHIHTIS